MTYNVYGNNIFVDQLYTIFVAQLYNNGILAADSVYSSLNQTTIPQAQPVPEPVTILGTLLAGGLGVALKKKTKL